MENKTVRLLVPTGQTIISKFIPKGFELVGAPTITHVVLYSGVKPGGAFISVSLKNKIYDLDTDNVIDFNGDGKYKWTDSLLKLDNPIYIDEPFFNSNSAQIDFVKNTFICVSLTTYGTHGNICETTRKYDIFSKYNLNKQEFTFESHQPSISNGIEGVIIEFDVKLCSKPQDVLKQYKVSLSSNTESCSNHDNHPSDIKSDEDYKSTSHIIKEDKQMEKKILGRSYGPINDGRVALDISGQMVFAPDYPEYENLSYKKFDQKTGKVVDMLDNVIALKASLAYAVPVNVSDIAKGDVIINDDDWYAVKSITKDHIIKGINLKDSTMLDIVPQSIMGSDMGFVTKIINLMNPCKLDPMLIMMVLNNDEEEETMDTKTAMLMMMMNNNGGAANNNMNMMLPMMLLGDDDDDKSSTMLMLMMMNQNGGCNCGGMNMNNMLPMLMLGKDFDKKDLLMFMMMMQNNNQNQQKIDPPANEK